MKTITYSYRSGLQVIPQEISDGVVQIIEKLDFSIGKYDIRKFKDKLLDGLKTKGWSGQAFLSSKSSISITSLFLDVGLCAQTGNMARMYADLLKLQAMYVDEKIKAGVFVLPTKDCAKKIGGNVANYDRFLNELTNIFSKVITVPMVIIGFDNEEAI